MLAPNVHSALAAILPPSSLLVTPEETRPYECDGLTMYRELPAAVALPENEAQLVAVLRRCHAAGVPVVARGAGTSLSGGALPDKRGVVLSLWRSSAASSSIDPLACTAVVQPGVRNLAISAAVAPYGLYYAPDPSSQIACTIGGNVARERRRRALPQVRADRAQRPPRARRCSSPARSSSSAATRSTARATTCWRSSTAPRGCSPSRPKSRSSCTPKPQTAQVALAAFADVGAAGAAVAAVIGAGIVPAGLEMMDQPRTRAVEEFVHAGYPLDAAAVLLVETDGTPEEVAADMAEITRVLGRGRRHRDSRVEGRDASACCSGRAGRRRFPRSAGSRPDYYCIDGTIPRRALAQRAAADRALSQQYNLRCANVFHAGDGNLHPLILYRCQHRRRKAKRAEAFGAAILELCIEVGGTITGEHGVGVEKLPQMCVQFRPAELECFLAVKAAFDPQSLLNPGQGRSHAVAVRGIRQDARAPRQSRASRVASLLGAQDCHEHACRITRAPPRRARRRRSRDPADGRLWRARARRRVRSAISTATAKGWPTPACPTSSYSRTRTTRWPRSCGCAMRRGCPSSRSASARRSRATSPRSTAACASTCRR